MGAKGGSLISRKIETTVYQSNISTFDKSMDLLISHTLKKNNNSRLKSCYTVSFVAAITCSENKSL